MTRILVFGDSTAYGAWDAEGGWADRLKRYCHERTIQGKMYCLVYTLGVSGKSTDDMLMRFEAEARERMKEMEESIFIIAAGTNDSKFVHSKGCREVPPERFRKNLKRLISLAKKRSEKVIFIGPTPVDQSKTDTVPWNKDRSFRNADIREYSGIMEAVCKEQRVHFIGMLDALRGPNLLFKDGLHPSTEGHAKMFRIVRDFLLGKGILEAG